MRRILLSLHIKSYIFILNFFLFSYFLLPSLAQAQKNAKMWTNTMDWASASTYKTITWTDVPGQIQLIKNPPKSRNTPVIYIPNSQSNTITQLDTKTGKRNWTISLNSVYRNSDPSRTTVDANGDVWVGLRNTDKVVWISAKGKIKKIVRTGQKPRAITVDLQGNIWVGNWTSNTLTKLNGKTGSPMFTVKMNCPYGATTDIKGNVWIVNRCKGQLTKVNSSGKVLGVYSASNGYGIATDVNGQVWVANYGSGCVYRYSNSGHSYGCLPLGYGCKNARGVAVDGDSNAWIACSNTPLVVKVSSAGKVLGANRQVGRACVGMAVDADGYIWAIAQGDATASKIHSKTLKLVGKYPTYGKGPYTYSDMTGFQFQSIARAASGYWRAVHFTQCRANWTKVTWNGATPHGTKIVVRARTAPTKAGLAVAKWSTALSNGGKPPVPSNQWIEVEVALSTYDSLITPYVTDVTVAWVPVGDEICDGKDNNCDGIIDNIPGTNRPLTKSCKTKCGSGFSPCIAGDWAICSAPYPTIEVCDGKDNDCNGKIDDGASTCPGQALCYQGACSHSCVAECPAGQLCKEIKGGHYCVGTKSCADIEATCKAQGKVCRLGRCVGLCFDVTCPKGYVCEKGLCMQDNCYNPNKPCPTGQVCRSGKCVNNPCAKRQCPPSQFCKNGQCLPLCDDQKCPAGQTCKNGRCQKDPCYGIHCKKSEVCNFGKCQKDPCALISCQNGRTCVKGQCIDDPCAMVSCPAGQVCKRPQGDCFGAGSGTPAQGEPTAPHDGGSVFVPDTNIRESTQANDNPPNDTNNIMTEFKTYIPETTTKKRPRSTGDCFCSATSFQDGFGSLALFLFVIFFAISTRRRQS